MLHFTFKSETLFYFRHTPLESAVDQNVSTLTRVLQLHQPYDILFFFFNSAELSAKAIIFFDTLSATSIM